MHDKYRLAFLETPANFTNISKLLQEQMTKQKELEKELSASTEVILNQAAKRRFAKVPL
jgi:hypothetical protein